MKSTKWIQWKKKFSFDEKHNGKSPIERHQQKSNEKRQKENLQQISVKHEIQQICVFTSSISLFIFSLKTKRRKKIEIACEYNHNLH